jgi:LAO/AO transport system kinase
MSQSMRPMQAISATELVDRMLTGDQRALARLISRVEQDSADVPAIMQRLYPVLGKAFCIGITGPPGAGKSTVTDKLTAHVRQLGMTVGIIAVDPTSPFSGGAVLGDRIRMQQHYLDDGVFIRSMATRGRHGGLSHTAKGAIKLLDAFGKDIIMVETVGVGQTELDIVETADTTVVILVPEAGDTVQAMKAGLMEIADLFVVNKADRDGADRMLMDLRMLVHMNAKADGWEIPVLATQAHVNVGLTELYEAIQQHHTHLRETGQLTERRRAHRRRELLELLQHRLLTAILERMDHDSALNALVQQVQDATLDPYTAVQQIVVNYTPSSR